MLNTYSRSNVDRTHVADVFQATFRPACPRLLPNDTHVRVFNTRRSVGNCVGGGQVRKVARQ